MRYLILLVFLLPSCTAFEAMREVAVKAEATVTAAQEAVATIKTTYAEERAKADKDGDGKLSMTEMLAYLASVLGAGGGVMLARNAKSNARKDVLERDVADLKTRTLK